MDNIQIISHALSDHEKSIEACKKDIKYCKNFVNNEIYKTYKEVREIDLADLVTNITNSFNYDETISISSSNVIKAFNMPISNLYNFFVNGEHEKYQWVIKNTISEENKLSVGNNQLHYFTGNTFSNILCFNYSSSHYLVRGNFLLTHTASSTLIKLSFGFYISNTDIVGPSIGFNNILIEDYNYKSLKQYVGFLQGNNVVNTVNLSNIKHKMFCNISKNSSLTFNSTTMGNLEVGKESHIIINNTGSTSIVVTIPNAAPYYSNVDEIAIDAGMYGEVNVIKGYNNKIYIRAI